MKVKLLSLLALMVASSTLHADPLTKENARAAMLSQHCYSCHGINGKSPSDIPSLSTKRADEIMSKLLTFRSGAAPSTIMGYVSQGYTLEELAKIASYIEAQNKVN